jgi:hypothetical protein
MFDEETKNRVRKSRETVPLNRSPHVGTSVASGASFVAGLGI